MTKLYLNKSYHFSLPYSQWKSKKKLNFTNNIIRVHTACLYGSQIRVEHIANIALYDYWH